MKKAISISLCVGFALFVMGCSSSNPKPTSGDMEAVSVIVSPSPAQVNQDTTIDFEAKNKGESDVTSTYEFEAVGPMSNWNMQYYRGYAYNVSVPKGATVAESVNNWRPGATGVAYITCTAQLSGDPTSYDNSKKIYAEVKEGTSTSGIVWYHILPFPFKG